MLNPVLIKKKAKEMAIPFDNLLYGCLLEEFIVFISENNHDELWVTNDNILCLDSYRRGIKDTLILTMNGDEDLEVYVRKFSLSVVSYFMNIGVPVSTSFSTENKVRFELKIDNMKIPVHLVIQKAPEISAFTKKKELKLTLQGDRSVTYLEYPIEDKVSELAFHILDKLELLGEMEMYIDLYDLLVTEPVEGRKVKECLSKKCEGKSGFDMERFETLRSYRDYPYMQKKYKRAQKRTKRNELTWKDVHVLIIRFLEPIYKAYVNNEVFFGDWMPDIARFLD